LRRFFFNQFFFCFSLDFSKKMITLWQETEKLYRNTL
jgi:hypothetical protein